MLFRSRPSAILVSIEKRIADGLGLKLGDEIVVNVLGRDIAARIGNMRTIDWQGLGINFVLVYSPNAFKGAPHTHIATLTETHPDPASDGRTAADSSITDQNLLFAQPPSPYPGRGCHCIRPG